MKPLFIPLRAEWYEAFERNEKDTEYRAYGPRWNENTCPIGRAAVLSYGYGRARRMNREVTTFRKLPFSAAPKAAQDIYPNADFIAAITLR